MDVLNGDLLMVTRLRLMDRRGRVREAIDLLHFEYSYLLASGRRATAVVGENTNAIDEENRVKFP